MMFAPIPKNDDERLASLYSYGILDTAAEEHFDSITKTIAEVCECKISVISFVDKDRQWLKSKQGIDICETPRDISFCGHTILDNEVLIVEDALDDERFCDNPMVVNEPHVRFYAGAPLITSSGHRIGTLCVIDFEKKTLDKSKINLLESFAKQVVNYLELSKLHTEKLKHIHEIDFYKKGLDAHAIIAKTDAKGKIIYVNDKFCEISKYSRDELIGKDHRIINSGAHSSEFFKDLWQTISSGKTWRAEIRNMAKDGSFYWVDTTILPFRDYNGKITEYMSFRYDITDKKESEMLNAEIQRMNKIGGWEVELSSMTPIWNEETYRIHDIEVGSPVDLEKAIEFFAPHEREKISNYVKDAIEFGKSYEDDFDFISAKGIRKIVRAKGIAEEDKSGKVVRLLGTFQDVTEQKKLQKEIVRSNQFMDLALEGSGLGVWDYDLRTQVISFDERWAKILGLSTDKNSMSYEDWESLIHPDDLDYCRETIGKYNSGESKKYESIHRIKHSEGHWIYVLDKGKYTEWDANGWPIRFTGTYLDITDTKKAQDDKLNEINDILLSTPSCLKIITKEGLLLDMNSQGLDLIEAPDMKSVYKANVYDIVEPSHREKFIEFNERICNGAKESLIFEIIGLEGTRRWMETYAAPFKLPSGEYAHIAITNDISERIQKENEFNRQKEISLHNSKLASIGELAAGVGHEINNPLAIMKGYVDVLKKNIQTDINGFDAQTYLKNIDIAIGRVSKIVEGLRIFSRSDAQDNTYYDPVSAVEESFNLVSEIYFKEGVEIVFIKNDVPADITVLGVRGKLQQVLMNLISNAKDAVVESNQLEKKIKITLDYKNKHLLIRVKDNGIGITKEKIEKIFNPFFTTKDTLKGTGIGLSMVHNIIKEMNGEISVESIEGKGSTFSVSLPVELNKSKLEVEKTQSENSSDLELRGNILIAEDEEFIREILADMLEETKLHIDLVENGEEALKLIQSKPDFYDLVISDMQMPRMDGISLLKNLRDDKNLKQPKFIFLTGGTNIDLNSKEGDLAGLFDGYLYKPFDQEKVLLAINDQLNKK